MWSILLYLDMSTEGTHHNTRVPPAKRDIKAPRPPPPLFWSYAVSSLNNKAKRLPCRSLEQPAGASRDKRLDNTQLVNAVKTIVGYIEG